MENNNLLKTIENVQEYLLYSLPFFVILFFAPIFSDFFEFAKYVALLTLASLLFLIWAVRSVIEKKLYVVKTPLDLGIALFALSAIISTVTSVSKFPSLLGQGGKIFPNIFNIVALLILYYSVTSASKKEAVATNAIKSVVVVSGLGALLGTLSHFGILYKITNLAWLSTGFIVTTGSPATLAIVSAIATILGLGIVLEYLAKGKTPFAVLFALPTIASSFYFAFLGSTPALLAFLVSLVLFVYTLSLKKGGIDSPAKMFFGGTVAFIVVVFALFKMELPAKVTKVTYIRPIEANLDLKTSWQISAAVLRDRPFFGTGLSTFINDFTIYKPVSFNSSRFWDARFFKPNNEFLRVLTEQGIFGLVAMSLLLLSAFRIFSKATKVTSMVSKALLAGTLGSFCALFTFSLNISLVFFVILLFGLSALMDNSSEGSFSEELVLSISAIKQRFLSLTDDRNQKDSKSEVLTYIFLGLALLISLPLLFVSVKTSIAETHRRNALVAISAGNIGVSYNEYATAISSNPFAEEYRRDFAEINLLLLQNLLAQKKDQKELTDQDKQDIANLSNQIIREVRLTTEQLNPISVYNWEQRARMYDALSALDANAKQLSLDAFVQAVQLDPTNPALIAGSAQTTGIGGLLFGAQDYQRAAVYFSQAIQLKPDYANAYFNLALAQIQLKNYEPAIANMEIVLRLLPVDSQDYKTVSGLLEELTKIKKELDAQQSDLKAQQAEQQGQTVPQQPVQTQPAVQNPQLPTPAPQQ